jgi:hypothetical protein
MVYLLYITGLMQEIPEAVLRVPMESPPPKGGDNEMLRDFITAIHSDSYIS